ncbi:putative RNA methyltransferase [Zongyangia hominis]|uniref:Methyltransferase domain-containing protein n=1 Tax=Zongyangia hominis TaxID=2763677 RepID=A0A926EC43_9FIRM|nr:methyltransferase domain-containing protein [Zongyangia hominis]MBC8570355.1 methyltransferase domain-containing protein [Zongyangia hominis]
MTELKCPVCGDKLFAGKGAYRCRRGHAFDISRQGYCNLLTGGRPAKTPGDNQEMARARHFFFAGDPYRILLDALSRTVCRLLPDGGVLVDAGCGEGYYTAGIHGALEDAGKYADVLGFDLSKFALRYAAKRDPAARFLAASLFSLPLFDGCADLVLSVFAPVAGREFGRILRPGGTLLIVCPGPRHLFGLKEVLYERPYENAENNYDLDGFTLLEKTQVRGEITLQSGEDIHSLFLMTPYYWKSPRAGCERLSQLDQLTTPIEFEVRAYRWGE